MCSVGAQLPPAPEGLGEWGGKTSTVMFAGLAIGGLRQWLVERRLPDIPPPSSMRTQAQIARFKAEMETRRLARLFNGMLRGGLWFAGLGGLYFGVQSLSEYARRRRDAYNTVFGAWAGGAAMGFAASSGGLRSRLGSAALGAGLAGLVGFPLGLAQQYLDKISNDDDVQLPDNPVVEVVPVVQRPYPSHDFDVVGKVVERLEMSLKDSPTRRQDGSG
ncbi:unnamed protein product [Ostreobium quekettii]|uniref:Mitochondrial inner membrane translocase subunit Tim17/Tim22/Tim23/peroxisomal protein PMP24 n=1 Tax=Ostreobium quekettii TaxID=121088 RepID=A0A8S1J160_9CHLO|nr:unnamed protein product [Ostreobium quekettii]